MNVEVFSILPIVVIAAVVLAFWSYDVWDDRRHIVSVLADTPVYVGHGSGACGGVKLSTVQKGTKLPVRRIRYWKNCATLDVVLWDGRTGHIVLGDGSVSIAPPLDN